MIFDTNILIYADRGVLSAKELIMNTQERSISAVTYMEYVPFCRNKRELAIFEKMLRALHKLFMKSTTLFLIVRGKWSGNTH